MFGNSLTSSHNPFGVLWVRGQLTRKDTAGQGQWSPCPPCLSPVVSLTVTRLSPGLLSGVTLAKLPPQFTHFHPQAQADLMPVWTLSALLKPLDQVQIPCDTSNRLSPLQPARQQRQPQCLHFVLPPGTWGGGCLGGFSQPGSEPYLLCLQLSCPQVCGYLMPFHSDVSSQVQAQSSLDPT